MNKSGRSPPGAENDIAIDLDVCAECAESVEVRIQAPAPDHVSARRRHLSAAESSEQRTGEQEGGADPPGRAPGRLLVIDSGGAHHDFVFVSPFGGLQGLEERKHRVDVADARHIAKRRPLPR